MLVAKILHTLYLGHELDSRNGNGLLSIAYLLRDTQISLKFRVLAVQARVQAHATVLTSVNALKMLIKFTLAVSLKLVNVVAFLVKIAIVDPAWMIKTVF